MSIVRKGNFDIFEDPKSNKVLIGINSQFLHEVAMEFEKGYDGFFCRPTSGFNESSLDFLSSFKNSNSATFYEVELKSIDGIYGLSKLQKLSFHGKFPSIDFSRLNSLVSLNCDYRRKDKNLSSLINLKLLHFWYVNPKNKSFNSVEFPETLEELYINWTNVTSLDGLPSLPNLKTLELHMCRNLESISNLERIAPNLEKLNIENAKKLNDFSVIDKLKNLSIAYCDDRKLTS